MNLFQKVMLLIISNFSLCDELLRLILVSSLFIFTPNTFFKEGDNILSRGSRGKKYIQYHHIKDFSLFQSQLNTLKASSGPGLLHSLLSKSYSTRRLLFMRSKLQINCFETLLSWAPRAPRSNYMDFMTKCKKKKKLKGQTFCTKSFDCFFFHSQKDFQEIQAELLWPFFLPTL